MKKIIPKYIIEYDFKPTQKLGDKCVRGNYAYNCIEIKKYWFIYKTILKRTIFAENEF
jgi:hypothetical protein